MRKRKNLKRRKNVKRKKNLRDGVINYSLKISKKNLQMLARKN